MNLRLTKDDESRPYDGRDENLGSRNKIFMVRMKAFIEKRFFKPIELKPAEKERLLIAIKEYLCSMNNIVLAYVHGSFVKSKNFRNVDIALFVEGKSNLYLESDISVELTSTTGVEVEVRVMNDDPVAFQMAVLRNGVLLFSRDEVTRTDFIEDAADGIWNTPTSGISFWGLTVLDKDRIAKDKTDIMNVSK